MHRSSTIPATALLLALVSPSQSNPELAAPVRLEADGVAIDTVANIGHAGPQLRDLDGDGKPELLVSSFGGSIRYFTNTGKRNEPRFVEREPLQAEGEAIRIHNW
jgi:hypothetical protein